MHYCIVGWGQFLSDEPGSNAHGLNLLHQKLARIWDPNLGKLCGVLARLATVDALVRIHVGHHATLLAHVNPVVVRAFHEALLEKARDAMCPVALDLHLSKTKTAIPCTSLCWLTSEENNRATTAPAVDLIIHHVLQSLVIRRSNKDGRGHLLACPRIIHDLVAISLKATRCKRHCNILHCHTCEW